MQKAPQRSITPCVSVIIAAYNAQETLARAVASALDQAMPVEVLVIDDASGDDTVRIACNLAETDDRVRLIRSETNGGPSMARNLGLAAAQGEWVAILDADDAFLPGRLARMTMLAERHGADMMVDNLLFYDWQAGRVAGCALDLPDDHVQPLSVTEFVRNSMTGRSPFDYGQLKPLFRNRFLQSRGLRYPVELRHGEDFALAMDALLLGARCMLVGEGGYLFTQRIGAISSDSSGHSRTVLNLQAMRDHTLAMLARPRIRTDAALARLLTKRAQAIRDQASWNRAYPYLRARRPGALLLAMLRDRRSWPMLARHMVRRHRARII
jgi:succinoglycan biosynthesis protein ExoO